MNVGAVGAVGQGSGAVYALSPYLSGTVRPSDAATAAEGTARTAATSASVATAATVAATTTPDATALAPAAAPYLNPAISDIAARAAITPAAGTAIVATPAATGAAQSTSPVAALQGDSGLLIQSYGAVALVAAPLALAPIFTQPAPLAIPPVAAVPATQGVDFYRPRS